MISVNCSANCGATRCHITWVDGKSVQQQQRRPVAADAGEDAARAGVDPFGRISRETDRRDRTFLASLMSQASHDKDAQSMCTRMTFVGLLLLLHRLPADVAAAEAFRPVDAVDGLVGASLRLRYGLARARRHSARDRHWRGCARPSPSCRRGRSRRPRSWRRHRAPRSACPSRSRRDSLSPPSPPSARHSGYQRRSKFLSWPSQEASNAGTMSDIIRSISTWHSGSPKRTLYSNSFGPSAVSITPGIEHAAKRRAALPSCRRRSGRMILAMIASWIVRRHERRRRIGAHAAGVRALVVIEHPLVVLRGGERDRGLAVAQREEADLAARQEFLDHDLGAGRAERAARTSWRWRPRPRARCWRRPRPCRRPARRP